MFSFLKKKKKDEETYEESEDAGAEISVAEAAPVQIPQGAGGAGELAMAKVTADIEKLKAQFTTFFEMQKTVGERFSRVNEQVGELRSLMIERDKSSQHLEAKATQAIDLVKTVQPDKMMIEIRKMDGKIEALKANIESSETIVGNMMSELKDVKARVNIFRGMEQVIQLNEEAKKALLEVKKVQSVVERHADKVETIFTEMNKKFADFVKFADTVKDLDKSFKQISSDFDSIKVKMADFATKKEMENLITKMDDFEKYTGSIIKLINNRFEKLQKELTDDFRHKFDDTDKLLRGFETLAMKTPDLDKYFNLLSEEAKRAAEKAAAPAQPEKLKEVGEEAPEPKPEQKESILGKVKGILPFGKK